MTDYPPFFDDPDGRRRRFPQQSGVPELSGGLPRPGYRPTRRPSDDPVDDPELSDVVDLVGDVLHEHRMRPAARDQLRARLMAAAAAQVQTDRQGRAPTRSQVRASPAPQAPDVATDAPGTEPGSRPVGAHRVRPTARPSAGPARIRRSSRPAPAADAPARRRPQRRVPVLGWSAMGAAAALASVLIVLRGGAGVETPIQAVVATPGIVDRVSADPGEGLTISFSQPMDPASVTAALRLTPATTVTTSWQGSTMTVSPLHGFAPNSAYVLTIDRTVAKTASGGSPASDVKVTFGTAPVAQAVAGARAPGPLPRTVLTAADNESEAVVTHDGSVLVAAAAHDPGKSGPSGLVRMTSAAEHWLGVATPAIAVSRSGRSVAFLTGSGAGTQIAFADGTGATQRQVPAIVDPNTPLGWIGDEEVAFVSGGGLRAVNRAGQVRILMDSRLDSGDSVVLAPGGRYVYLAHGKEAGVVIDLVTGRKHGLSGALGVPTFSADGSTVYWTESHNSALHLNSAPSGNGPTMSVRLPDLTLKDSVSDLSVSPDGSLLAYSVTHPDGSAGLRLASLPTLVTLAISHDGTGRSPNWSPDARMFTVRATGGSGARIQAVHVPKEVIDGISAAAAVAQSFANAQINGDADAQRTMAPGVLLPGLPERVTRANVIYVRSTGKGTATATIRLSVDPTASNPVYRQTTETLELEVPDTNAVPKVSSVSLGRFGPAPGGPQLTRVDTRSAPGAALLTFDSDLNPLTVPGAVAMLSADGSDVAVTASYDTTTRSVRVQPAASVPKESGAATVMVTSALRDVAGNPMAVQLALPVQLGPTSR